MRPMLFAVLVLSAAGAASSWLLPSTRAKQDDNTWYRFPPASTVPWAGKSTTTATTSSTALCAITQLQGRLCSSCDAEDSLPCQGRKPFDEICMRGTFQCPEGEAICDATNIKVTVSTVDAQATATVNRLTHGKAKFELKVPFKDLLFSRTLEDLPCEVTAKVSLKPPGQEELVEQELKESRFGFNFGVLMAHFASYLSGPGSVPVVNADGNLTYCPTSLKGQIYLLPVGLVGTGKTTTCERMSAVIELQPVDTSRIGSGSVRDTHTKTVTVRTISGPSLDVKMADSFGIEEGMSVELLRPFLKHYYRGQAVRWDRSVVRDFEDLQSAAAHRISHGFDDSSAPVVVIFCSLETQKDEAKQQLKVAYDTAVAADIPVVVVLTHANRVLGEAPADGDENALKDWQDTKQRLLKEKLLIFDGYNPEDLVMLPHDENNVLCCSCVKGPLSVLHQAARRVHAHRKAKYSEWLSEHQHQRGLAQAELARGEERWCVDQVMANAIDGRGLEDPDVQLEVLDCCRAKYATLQPKWDSEQVDRTCLYEYTSRLES